MLETNRIVPSNFKGEVVSQSSVGTAVSFAEMRGIPDLPSSVEQQEDDGHRCNSDQPSYSSMKEQVDLYAEMSEVEESDESMQEEELGPQDESLPLVLRMRTSKLQARSRSPELSPLQSEKGVLHVRSDVSRFVGRGCGA